MDRVISNNEMEISRRDVHDGELRWKNTLGGWIDWLNFFSTIEVYIDEITLQFSISQPRNTPVLFLLFLKKTKLRENSFNFFNRLLIFSLERDGSGRNFPSRKINSFFERFDTRERFLTNYFHTFFIVPWSKMREREKIGIDEIR